MYKKILLLVLAAVIAFSIVGTAMAKEESAQPSKWALEEVKTAEAVGITESGKDYSYQTPITREDFSELIYNYCSVAGKVDGDNAKSVFEDTANAKTNALASMEIVKGKSEKEFAPADLLTREEAATILFRTIDTLYPDWTATELYFGFEDAENISDWAMNSIQTICNMGIMKGVGSNMFAPKDNFTTEQAIATVVRIYKAFDLKREGKTFADKLYADMPADKNYMFSPLSIKTALMMAANGASGETLGEILKAADVDDLESYNKSIREMIDKYSKSDILTLNISDSIWINSDNTPQRFSGEYQDKLAKVFDATSDIVTGENALSKINGWVNEKTNGKIPTIISEDNKDFAAMLVNAVYFKGGWEETFNKNATRKDIFTSRDGSETEIDFMHRTNHMYYANTDGVLIVSLPYRSSEDVFGEDGRYIETKRLDGVNVSMYLMMSDGSFSPEDVLSKAKLSSAYIDLSVPKFKIEYDTELSEMLKNIGINKAFGGNAEFEKMFDTGNMYIDSVLHKTYIDVDEEGTEAAAVTALLMKATAALIQDKPLEVKFNKPFTFVIRDDANGEILFMGEYAFAN